MWFSQMERTNEFFTIFTRDFKSNYRVGSFSFYGTYIDWSSTNIMEVFLGDNIDELNQLKKPTKIEREIKTFVHSRFCKCISIRFVEECRKT